MMTPSFTSILSVFLVATSAMVNAAPIKPVSDIVFNPTITCPHAGDVWTAGSTQTVTWETDNIPAVAQGYSGVLYLGHSTPGSENLDTEHPLAQGFKYSDGTVTFQVPQDLFTRPNYQVYLLGDSGNGSPAFTINGIFNPLDLF